MTNPFKEGTEATATTDANVSSGIEQPLNTTPATTGITQEGVIKVTENSAYKDVDALIKGKAEADKKIAEQHITIAEMRSELDSLRHSIDVKGEIAALTEALKKQKAQGEESTQAPINQASIEEVTLKVLTERERKLKEEANLNASIEALNNHFGDKASEAVKSRAEALGMSVRKLEETAKESPQAFAALMQLNQNTQANGFNLKGTHNTVAASLGVNEPDDVKKAKALLGQLTAGSDGKAFDDLYKMFRDNPDLEDALEWKTK